MPSFPALSDAVRNGASRHRPVMLAEVLAALSLESGDRVIDGTFGAGGYSAAILNAAPDIHVMAIDRDPDAIRDGAALVEAAEGRLNLVEGRFGDLASLAEEHGFIPADAIVLDIGVSSMQIDQAERGFSFQKDGPLDMRMSAEGASAADLVNSLEEEALADILWRHGEEPRSRRIARAIVAARPITRTLQLAEVVRRAVGYRAGAPRDPATRTFQALRIEVNGELDELDAGLRAAERLLRPGGRLAVVTFHSLEDRAVKQFLRTRSGTTGQGSRHRPDNRAEGPAPTFEPPAKALRPSDSEIAQNPRARSATLRAARRTSAPAWEA